MKDRMRVDLRAALRDRRADDARLLRALVAAIDNAEAPPLEGGRRVDQHRFEDRSAEIELKYFRLSHTRALTSEQSSGPFRERKLAQRIRSNTYVG